MTSDDTHDPVLDALKRLQSLTPDHAWTDRVRMRCRTQLGRRQRPRVGTDVMEGFARRVLAPGLVGAFCVLYIAALVTTTLRLHGVFR